MNTRNRSIMIFDDYSYLVQGDPLPEVSFTALEGSLPPRLKKGNIVLINFFIIPCKHCKHMLEYLQEEIWPEFQETANRMLAVGRGHSPRELSEFRNNGNYILPLAADPDRKNFDLFAEKKVPRNYLFDHYGKLVYQTRGFDLDQLATMKTVLGELEIE